MMQQGTITVVIKVNSLKELIDFLKKLKANVNDPPKKEILEAAGEIVHKRTFKNFLDSEQPDGTPFAPIKPSSRPGWGGALTYKPLIKTGYLFGMAMQATASPIIEGNTLSMDAGEPFYGAFHLVGTKNMPARIWLGMTEVMVDEMASEGADKMLDKALDGIG